jgi:hypothetical protein
MSLFGCNKAHAPFAYCSQCRQLRPILYIYGGGEHFCSFDCVECFDYAQDQIREDALEHFGLLASDARDTVSAVFDE